MDASGLVQSYPVMPAPAAQTVGASPWTFTATAPGTLVVQGGTLSLMQLKRGATAVTLGVLAGAIPVQRGDSVVITYVAAPTVTLF